MLVRVVALSACARSLLHSDVFDDDFLVISAVENLPCQRPVSQWIVGSPACRTVVTVPRGYKLCEDSSEFQVFRFIGCGLT